MKILLLSDIHGNFPALKAIIAYFRDYTFAATCNCGDSIVYGPFPNETLHWLETNNVHSILGNTDRKIRKLLSGKNFKRPKKPEKRIMYTWTAGQLDLQSRRYLCSLDESNTLQIGNLTICLFHGSPAHPNEFLSPYTETTRFEKLATASPCPVIVTGHSHMPYHKQIGHTHFINPGSVGRMFDSNPASSCAILTLSGNEITVTPYRIPYQIEETTRELGKQKLPESYKKMYELGQKTN